MPETKQKSGRRTNENMLYVLDDLRNNYQFFDTRKNENDKVARKLKGLIKYYGSKPCFGDLATLSELNSEWDALLREYEPKFASLEQRDKKLLLQLRKSLKGLIEDYRASLSAENDAIPDLNHRINLLVTQTEILALAKRYEHELYSPEGRENFGKQLRKYMDDEDQPEFCEHILAQKLKVSRIEISKLLYYRDDKNTTGKRGPYRTHAMACYLKAFSLLAGCSPGTFLAPDKENLIMPVRFPPEEDENRADYITLFLMDHAETESTKKMLDLIAALTRATSDEQDKVSAFLSLIKKVEKTETPDSKGYIDKWRVLWFDGKISQDHINQRKEIMKLLPDKRGLIDLYSRILTLADMDQIFICDMLNFAEILG